MPWKESSVLDERLRFMARLLEGEPMTDVCREFGISRKAGYKIYDRYKEHGLAALTDRPRRPVRYANQLPQQIEAAIVSLKQEKPHWGARKIRELLVRRLSGDVRVPAKSTIHAVLDRHGLVKRARSKRRRATGTPLSLGQAPNDLWCADYKGEFKLGNGQYCYPLTVTDQASRYLLLCEALESTREDLAVTAFERLFQERGLPLGIRSDNGDALRQCQRLIQPQSIGRLVAPPRHPDRAHQARQAPAERPPRAHASDPEEGSDQATRHEQLAAAGQVRRLPRGVQRRAAARSPRDEMSS
jgi:transposase InsO family protein